MPMYDYLCGSCSFKKEHFDKTKTRDSKRICPSCSSEDYKKELGSFMLNVEYSTVEETLEYKIDPAVQEVRERIGREALDQDTKTLENVFGTEKVEKTFHKTDD